MYQAIVTKLANCRPHPNADRLQLATVVGNQVVIGLDHQDGEIGIYFPTDGQLSEKMCFENNLFSDSTLNRDQNQKGFFDPKRRVRTQKFRGEPSDGMWLPLECLSWYTNIQILNDGQMISDEVVCTKYITKATRGSGGQNKTRKIKRGETIMFPKHYDTDQFQYYYKDIPLGSIVYVTEKLHGTSGRYGLVKDDQENFVDRVCGYFGFQRNRWIYLNGSRNVVLEHTVGDGFYGTNDFRTEAVKNIQLRKGEVIYFELVGDVVPGSPIMPPVAVNKKELPDIYKQYGPIMSYNYNQPSGSCGLYVYRIVQMNEDGNGVDLSWPQVKRRCRELGLQVVPQLSIWEFEDWNDGSDMETPAVMFGPEAIEKLKFKVEELCEGPSTLDSSHIREGVCVRIETPDGRIYTLKHKSFVFKVLEGIVKLDDEYVDMEEAS